MLVRCYNYRKLLKSVTLMNIEANKVSRQEIRKNSEKSINIPRLFN